MSRPSALAAACGILVFLVCSARAGQVPPLMPPAEDGERVSLLVAVGLVGEAERELRAELASGVLSARPPLLRLLLREGRIDEATALLAEWSPLEDPLGHFLTGRIREEAGDWTGAAEAFAASAAREPLLADHAAFRGARALEEAGDAEGALAAYETAGGSARTQVLASQAWWRAAGLAFRTGMTERAIENLERIPTRSVIARQDLLDLEAQVWRAQGNAEREAHVLREVLDRVPSSEQAVAAIDRLSALAPPTVDDRLSFAEAALRNRHATLAETEARRALVALGDAPDPRREGKARLFVAKAKIQKRRYTAAREELEKLPASAAPEDLAEARLDRARCLWRLGQIDACLAEYDLVLESDAPEEFRAAAGWEAGREAKDNRRWDEAALRLEEFARSFPRHDRADDALWHAGRSYAEAGRREEAVAAFDRLRQLYPDSSFHEEATYWIAGLWREAGADSAACAETARLSREHPDSWWAQRAQAVSDCPPADAASDPLQDPFDWLAALSPEVDPARARLAGATIQQAEPFRRAEGLAAVGLRTEAENELAVLRHGVANDTAALVAFAEAAWKAGVPRAAMRAISIVRARTGQGILSGETPVSVARLLYPVDHLDSVLRWAGEYDLDPLFLYAVMREESWFDAGAVSWAGAYGLLQIMPSTGRDLARRIGVRNFDRNDLFDPDVNIRLGAFYLRSLLDELDSEPAVALSAYNAGKRNALRWKKGLDGEFDVDRYVAGITYNETYNYVQKVGRSWAIYRHLWGDVLPGERGAEDAPR